MSSVCGEISAGSSSSFSVVSMQTSAVMMALSILWWPGVFDICFRLSEQTSCPATCMGRSFKVVVGHATDSACRMFLWKPLGGEISIQAKKALMLFSA